MKWGIVASPHSRLYVCGVTSRLHARPHERAVVRRLCADAIELSGELTSTIGRHVLPHDRVVHDGGFVFSRRSRIE